MKLVLNPIFLSVFFLLFSSLFALKDLTKSGFYTSHDGETHTARIAQYYNALEDGQFPPRFARSFYSYLGSPIFVYIYPLPYAIGSAIHQLGFTYSNTFKLQMALGFVFSGLFSFLWLKEVTKSDKAAFMGALFYTFVPYRFLLIYVRASLSELLAYAFLPLALYATTKLASRKNAKWTAICAISISLVLLSQNLVALLTLPVLGVYMLISAFFEKSKKYLFLSVLSIVWAFLIASVTYAPSLLEREFVHFDSALSLAYQNHFVTLKQLIRSPWGYGFDLPGTVNDQMSFQLGYAQILTFAMALVLTLLYTIRNNRFFKSKIRNLVVFPSTKEYCLSVFFTLVLLLSIFMMVESKWSVYTWQTVKSLKIIDIPWRFLGLTALSMSYMAAFVAKATKPGLVFLFLVTLVLIANRNHVRINEQRQLDDNFFQNYLETATQYSEFTPKWRLTERTPLDFDPKVRVEATEGNAAFSNIMSNSKTTAFDVDVISNQATIRINKFYFPEVKITVDGQNKKPFEDFTITDSSNLDLTTQKDTSGLMQLKLERGAHTVNVDFKETQTRKIANYLTLLSLFAAAGIVVKNVKT